MGEDDIVELLWKSGHVVQRSQRPTSDNPSPPLILRGSGSGGGEGNAPIPQLPSLQSHHHPLRSELLYSGSTSTPATHPQSSVSLAPPPPSAPYGQIFALSRARSFINFSRVTGNIFPGGRVEAGPSMQVGSSATPSSSATESCVVPATEGTESRVSPTFAVKVVPATEGTESRVSRTFAVPVCEIAGTEPIQTQPATETELADERKRKEREKTIAQVQGTEEAGCSTSRKRSRAAEMHNISERRRREKITEKMKALQELIPRCNMSDRASMLDDVIEYVKSLQMQIQMMSMGHGMMPPMMYAGNIQQLVPHMAMGMMDMNRPPFIPFPGTPFRRPAHTVSLGPSYPAPHFPFTNVQASDPSRVHLTSPQPYPLSNQPQFPAYMNSYSQFVGLRQMQQPPPPLQSQTTSQLSFGQASSSKKPDDQDNQPTG